MKSNIIQAFFRKTGKKTEINSTVIEIIDYKCAKCTKNTRDIVYYRRNAHSKTKKRERMLTDTAKNAILNPS